MPLSKVGVPNLPSRTSRKSGCPEPPVEDDTDKPGRILVVNDNDDDGDFIPDFADGFNQFGDTTDANANETFVPLVLELAQPIDLNRAKLKIKYSASPPAGVTRSPLTEGGFTYTPASGALRIWTVDGNTARNSSSVLAGGNFVPANVQMDAADLGFGPGSRIITLFVESIAVSSAQADARIEVELDPDGRGLCLCPDAVRATIIRMEIATKGPNDTIVPLTDFITGVSDPSPTIEDLQVTASSFTSSGTLSLRLEGVVKDELSEVIAEASGKVQSVNFLQGSQTLATKSLTPESLAAELPWRPFPFEAKLDQDVTLSVPGPGDYTVTVETSPNAANNKGSRTVTVSVGSRTLPGSPGGDVTTLTANIILPAVVPPKVQIAMHYDKSVPDAGTFRDRLSPVARDSLDVVMTNESFPFTATSSRIRVRVREVDATGNPAVRSHRYAPLDGSFFLEIFTASGTPLVDSGSQLPASGATIRMEAFGPLFGVQRLAFVAPERDVSQSFSLIKAGLSAGRRLFVPDPVIVPLKGPMFSPYKLVYRFGDAFFSPAAGQPRRFVVQATHRFDPAQFNFTETVEDLGGDLFRGPLCEVRFEGFVLPAPQNQASLIEEIRSSFRIFDTLGFELFSYFIFLGEVADGGKSAQSSNVFRFKPGEDTNDPFDALTPESIQFYYGNRDVTASDPTLTENAGQEDSLIFNGTVGSTATKVRITQFNGLTDQVDTLTGEITYDFGDGVTSVLTATFTETGTTTGRFTVSFTFQQSEGAGTPIEVLTLDAIQVHEGNTANAFIPQIIRVDSPIDLSSIIQGEFFGKTDWELEQFTFSPDFYYLRKIDPATGSSQPVLFVPIRELRVGATFDNVRIADAVRDDGRVTRVRLVDATNGSFIGSYEITPLFIRVEWVDPVTDNLISDNNLHPNRQAAIGLRYFPGAAKPKSLGGTFNDRVKLRVGVSPQVLPIIPIFLRVFDPDDPSAIGNEVDADEAGGDNRGGRGTLLAITGKIFPGEDFVTTFTVSHQPGDNHKVGVALFGATALSALDDVTVRPGTESLSFSTSTRPGAFVAFSPLLTVWRRLHIEVDSMEAVPEDGIEPDKHMVHGVEWSIGKRLIEATGQLSDRNGSSVLRVSTGFEESIPAVFYDGGTVTSGNVPFEIVTNSSPVFQGPDPDGNPFHFLIEIDGEPSSGEQALFLRSGRQIIVQDDDQLNYPEGVLGDFLPRFDVVGEFTKEKFRPAYIEIAVIDVDTNTNLLNTRKTVPFVLNLGNVGLLTPIDDAKDVQTSAEYWAHLIVAAYQPNRAEDNDPDAENNMLGETNVFNRAISAVYIESINESSTFSIPPISQFLIDSWRNTLHGVVAHEIGHAPRPSGRSFFSNHDEGGLMGDGEHLGDFTPRTLNFFRQSLDWLD